MDIAVGVICTVEGKIFVTQRPEGSHLAGYWEFPGGKSKPGETIEQTLIRELAEEIDIKVHNATFLKVVQHHYQERHINLHVFLVNQWDGEPFAKEGQVSRWIDVDELNADDFPDANRSIIEWLKDEKPC